MKIGDIIMSKEDTSLYRVTDTTINWGHTFVQIEVEPLEKPVKGKNYRRWFTENAFSERFKKVITGAG